MPIGQNDVNILSVISPDDDQRENQPLAVRVRAEVGNALHTTGGKYRVGMTVTDETSLTQVDSQLTPGNYGDANWQQAGPEDFDFQVPAANLAGRAGHILSLQAFVIANQSAPFDASHKVGETLLVTP
jgi:hypothetical protein